MDKFGCESERRCIILKSRQFYEDVKEMAINELKGRSGKHFMVTSKNDFTEMNFHL